MGAGAVVESSHLIHKHKAERDILGMACAFEISIPSVVV